MFSIICCSVCPEAAEALRQNIAATIGEGVEYEFTAFDNRRENLPIATVYNRCASRARQPYLCFIHEDAAFLTEGWGHLLAPQLALPATGVVGFAGSIVKPARLTAWNVCGRDMRANYVQHMRGRRHRHHRADGDEAFTPVVTLDGFCLFVRRDVWAQTPFDADACPGFHGYDLDFTLAAATHRTNYVCHTVLVEHHSEGSFSRDWIESLHRLHAKWADRLPMCATPLSEAELERYDRSGEAYFIKFMWQKGCFDVRGLRHAAEYLRRYPSSGKAWGLLPKYVKYRLRALLRRNRKQN